MHHHLCGVGGGGLLKGVAQHSAAALQLPGQCVPVQVALLELGRRPAFHRGEFGFSPVGQTQVEVAGAAIGFHQHHQQSITAGHQTDRLQLLVLLLRLGDQAHQTGEIRQPTSQMHQQVVQTGPTKTEAGELPFQVLNGDAGFRQQRVHVVPVSHRTGNASGGGVRLMQQSSALKRPHGGANGGGAGGNAEALHQGAAAHRLHRVDVVVHRRLKHLFLPKGQGLAHQ